ncbi:MAG: sulfotransferase domain-containing protein [Rhodothermales bacterium]
MEICFHMGIRFVMAHTRAHFEPFGSLDGLVKARKVDFLAYTNADSRHLDACTFYKGFHVVRDPRDVLVSAYFSHMHSHSTRGWEALAAHRERLRSVPREEGLFLELEFSKTSFEEFDRWNYRQPNVLEMKMEELSAAPLEGFLRILRFLEILDEERHGPLGELSARLNTRMNRLNHKGRRFMPGQIPLFPVPRIRRATIPAELLRRILDKKSFQRMSGGRKKGEEDVKNHFRKGVHGDWRNHFTPALLDAFKARYADLVVKLGYERDADWGLQP